MLLLKARKSAIMKTSNTKPRAALSQANSSNAATRRRPAMIYALFQTQPKRGNWRRHRRAPSRIWIMRNVCASVQLCVCVFLCVFRSKCAHTHVRTCAMYIATLHIHACVPRAPARPGSPNSPTIQTASFLSDSRRTATTAAADSVALAFRVSHSSSSALYTLWNGCFYTRAAHARIKPIAVDRFGFGSLLGALAV